ncbi:hypothetical protein EVAR_92830_1 [Eumeta japonica]|uniref:Uncharacterized protein n=1 Tax=Eumeta variegata TaxID=151549 RepID=A0A4C1TCH5_EUMVA|nr:hypothetical protein EVAR_92830_1 [Eumeta japonica]
MRDPSSTRRLDPPLFEMQNQSFTRPVFPRFGLEFLGGLKVVDLEILIIERPDTANTQVNIATLTLLNSNYSYYGPTYQRAFRKAVAFLSDGINWASVVTHPTFDLQLLSFSQESRVIAFKGKTDRGGSASRSVDAGARRRCNAFTSPDTSPPGKCWRAVETPRPCRYHTTGRRARTTPATIDILLNLNYPSYHTSYAQNTTQTEARRRAQAEAPRTILNSVVSSSGGQFHTIQYL